MKKIVFVLLLAIGPTACGNAVSATQAGRIGVMINDAGVPAAVVHSCGRATPVVQLSQGRPANDDGRTPNVERGAWTARDTYQGTEDFALTADPPGWTLTGTAPGTLEPDQLFVLTGGTQEDDETYLQQVSFRLSDLQGLPRNEILVEGGRTESPAEFDAYRCQ